MRRAACWGPDAQVIKSDAGSIPDTEAMITEVGRVFGGI